MWKLSLLTSFDHTSWISKNSDAKALVRNIKTLFHGCHIPTVRFPLGKKKIKYKDLWCLSTRMEILSLQLYSKWQTLGGKKSSLDIKLYLSEVSYQCNFFHFIGSIKETEQMCPLKNWNHVIFVTWNELKWRWSGVRMPTVFSFKICYCETYSL